MPAPDPTAPDPTSDWRLVRRLMGLAWRYRLRCLQVLALQGVTNDDVDFCVDTLKYLHLPAMGHFGVREGLELELGLVLL